MDITWRNITVKNKLASQQGSLLWIGIALLLAVGAVPGIAQIAGSMSTQSMPGTSNGSVPSTGKSGTGVQGMAPLVLPKDFSQLRIEPGDLLSVNVYDTPELTDAYRVDPDGNLTIPLCGKVKVQGLTAPEAAKLVETTLKDDQILVRPQVNVDVQQYAGEYVTVLGEVANPGRITVIAPTKLSDILAQAGGTTALAGSRIKIRQGADDSAPETEVHYSRTESTRETGTILMRPGDTVIVPRAGIVYVLGAVFRPGGYIMQEDGKLNAAEALAVAGGTLVQAKTSGLRVIRRNPDGTVLDFSLSYDGIAAGTQVPLELQAQDIVYVPMSKLKASLSDATGILSAATSAAIYTAR
jgi:polysaccharide export outer membrane protein